MEKEIIIHSGEGEIRAAVLEDRRPVEFYLERHYQRLVGNIYLGRVEDVLPGMQAAFVNIGLEKKAFLYAGDAVVKNGEREDGEEEKGQPNISDLVREGQEILVQVIKEPSGGKGARVTTALNLPGRYLVLTPGASHVGVSRRIEDKEERERLREMAVQLKPPGAGLIVRTAAAGVAEEELKRDVEMLTRLWRRIYQRSLHMKAPSLVHRDLELVQRIMRDIMSEDVTRVVVDAQSEYEKLLEVAEIIGPQWQSRIFYYDGGDVFAAFGLHEELKKALRPRVWLKSGGYIVIEQTEALTVIDVNTGKFVGNTSLADTVLTTNLEAAREVARQMRLRNLSGIIIVDFIDMPDPQHRQQVLEVLQEEVKKDRVKTVILGLTSLGLVEITRKKIRPPLREQMMRPCPCCEGLGAVLSEETVALETREKIIRELPALAAEEVVVEVHPAVAALLTGSGGLGLEEMERRTGKKIHLLGREDFHLERVEIQALVEGEKREEWQFPPVKEGQILRVKIDGPHSTFPGHGIGRWRGFVIDVEGGGAFVGQQVLVEVEAIFRTCARAKIIAWNGCQKQEPAR